MQDYSIVGFVSKLSDNWFRLSSTVEACINVHATTTAQGNPSHLELCRL